MSVLKSNISVPFNGQVLTRILSTILQSTVTSQNLWAELQYASLTANEMLQNRPPLQPVTHCILYLTLKHDSSFGQGFGAVIIQAELKKNKQTYFLSMWKPLGDERHHLSMLIQTTSSGPSYAEWSALCKDARPRLPAAAGVLIDHCMENGLISGFSWLWWISPSVLIRGQNHFCYRLAEDFESPLSVWGMLVSVAAVCHHYAALTSKHINTGLLCICIWTADSSSGALWWCLGKNYSR